MEKPSLHNPPPSQDDTSNPDTTSLDTGLLHPAPTQAPPSISSVLIPRKIAAVGRYHVKIASLITHERNLLLALSRTPHLLRPRQEATVRWAITLARLCLLRTPSGIDLDISKPLERFRIWLTELLDKVIRSDSDIDAVSLRRFIPNIRARLDVARSLLVDHYQNAFPAEWLDQTIRQKELVLVLGGGGGCGFVHLATFALMEKLGYTPKLLVGSSMGAMLGLFRAMRMRYDPEAILRVIPRSFDLSTVLKPAQNITRYGFPGVFELQLVRAASEALHLIEGTSRIPALNELPIRLEVVVTGVRTGFAPQSNLEARIQAASGERSMTPFALRKRLRLFYSAVRELSANPRLLRQLVFGVEEGTEDFNSVEAVGFSCSVPGLLHYDIYHDEPRTTSTLNALFEKHRLWRMTDGGVVNNVPSRVAWESVMQGNITSRNAFILAADPFAPIVGNANFLYAPVQQIARTAVLSNRPFSDYHKTFRSPPNPVNLAPGYAKLKRIIRKALSELEPMIPYIQRTMTPLPAYRSWEP